VHTVPPDHRAKIAWHESDRDDCRASNGDCWRKGIAKDALLQGLEELLSRLAAVASVFRGSILLVLAPYDVGYMLTPFSEGFRGNSPVPAVNKAEGRWSRTK
jgi:hypothetical protein